MQSARTDVQRKRDQVAASNQAAPTGGVQRSIQLRGLSYAQGVAALSPSTAGYDVQRRTLAPVQQKGAGERSVHDAAARGTAGGGGSLPFLSVIQKSFGAHDISGVKAHTGNEASAACQQMGAEAFATGNSVAFGGAPSLHTAAHEAAHIVQQRAGVSLKGGVGQAGDTYEQHADAVADLVVQGKSAESLLNQYTGGGSSAGQTQAKSSGAGLAVQRVELPTMEDVVEFGEDLLEGGRELVNDAVEFGSDIIDAGQDVVTQLQEAAAQGRQALEELIDQLPIDELLAALPSVPDALWQLLDLWWPSGTGWKATLGVGASGTLAGTDAGFPGDVSLGAGVGAEIEVMRSDKDFSISVKATGSVSGEAAPSVKLLETPLVATIEGFQQTTIATDFSQVTWPSGALDALMNGDLKGAFSTALVSCVDLANNTQVTTVYGASESLSIKGEAGLDSAAKLAAEAGVKAGLEVTVANSTETKEGKLEFKGAFTGFGSLNLEIAGEALSSVKALGDTLAGNLNEAANSGISAEAEAGMKFGITLPKLGESDYGFDVSVFAGGKAAASILGQSVEAGAVTEITLGLPDIPGFIEAVKGGEAGAAIALLPFSKVAAEYSAKLTVNDILGLFPDVTDLFSGIPNTNHIEASLTVVLEATREQAMALEATNGEQSAAFFNLLLQGDFRGALAQWADNVTEDLADVVAMVKSIKCVLEAGWKDSLMISTPGAGDFTGIGGSGSASLTHIEAHEWTAPEVGEAQLATYLRGLF